MNNETLDRRREFARKACKAAQILEIWGWFTGGAIAVVSFGIGVLVASERDVSGQARIGPAILTFLGGVIGAVVVTSIYVMIANYVKAKLAEYVD